MSPPPDPMEPSAPLSRALLSLGRAVLSQGRRRVGLVLLLTSLAGLAEGIAFLALAPLLRLAGLSEAGGGAPAPGRLAAALALYVALVAAAALVARGRAVATQSLTLDFTDHLRDTLHRAILAMEWAQFRRQPPGHLQQVMIGETSRMAAAATQLARLTSLALTMPFVLAASLLLSWPLTLAALTLVAAALLLGRRLGWRGFAVGREIVAGNRAAMADLTDDLGGLRVLKSLGAETTRSRAIAARFATIRRNILDLQRAEASEIAILQVAAAVAAAAGLYAAFAVLRLSLPEALALFLAYGRLLQHGQRGLTLWRQLCATLPAQEAYDRALTQCRAAAETDRTPDLPLTPPRQRLVLSAVSVRHADGQAGLTEVSAHLPVGAMIAVIGPSGAGKSTLADLLCGLTTPSQGEILLDDRPLPAASRAAWRRWVAVVPQDPFLFHDTIAANLRLARPDADDAELWQALEQAAAADFVRALPQGLDTVVGERGTRLSGGERQRVALAAAVLRRPALLVLDEATSALDGETEAAVAAALAGLRGRCTLLVVAHRPSTVRHADHVLLLEDGRLTAAGSWQQVRTVAGPRLTRLGLAAEEPA